MFDLRQVMLLTIVVSVASVSLAAAGLTDPMRPPAGYAISVSTPKAPIDNKSDWVLQSVLLGEGRAVAMINGVFVSRGEKYRGSRLLEVRTDEVVLQAQGGKKIILKLTPNIHIKKVSADTESNLK